MWVLTMISCNSHYRNGIQRGYLNNLIRPMRLRYSACRLVSQQYYEAHWNKLNYYTIDYLLQYYKEWIQASWNICCIEHMWPHLNLCNQLLVHFMAKTHLSLQCEPLQFFLYWLELTTVLFFFALVLAGADINKNFSREQTIFGFVLCINMYFQHYITVYRNFHTSMRQNIFYAQQYILHPLLVQNQEHTVKIYRHVANNTIIFDRSYAEWVMIIIIFSSTQQLSFHGILSIFTFMMDRMKSNILILFRTTHLLYSCPWTC